MNFKKILKILSIFITIIFIFSNFSACAGIKFYDSNTIGKVLKDFNSYRKCMGLFNSYLYGCPIVPFGAIVYDFLSDDEIKELNKKFGSVLMCRADAPFKKWYNLPSGRELPPSKINIFLQQCRKINSKSIILCLFPPSIYFTGINSERYERSGAANVILDPEKCIIIEHVGRGFDAGDITKGESKPHSHLYIPWHISNWDAEFIWNNIDKHHINQETYIKSRNQRIERLINFGYPKNILDEHIPISSSGIDKKTFVKIYEKCIRKIIPYLDLENFNSKYPVMFLIDFYGENLNVTEIWNCKI